MSTSLKNIRRSPYQSLAAIFVVSITIFICGVFALVTLASQEILLNFETKPQIIAYLKDGHTTDEVNLLLGGLTSTQGVQKAQYVSKEEALELYKQSVGNDPVLLGTVTDWGIVTADILPASVEITANSPNSFPYIAEVLEKSDVVSSTPQGKKEIDYPKDVISELTKWTNAIRAAGLILVLSLTVASVLTIMIIISMKISSRRLEIGTLKLLGAKNYFIIKPYLAEASLYGLAGGFFGWIFCFVAILYSTPFLATRLSGFITLPVPLEFMLLLLAAMLAFGWILSFIASYFAAARFVKRSK